MKKLLVLFLTSGILFSCAAGNYNFIRSVAKWNLKFSIFPRILIYIAFVLIPVYPIAAFLDVIIGNTIEFWTGSAIITADATKQEFDQGRYHIVLTHKRDPFRSTHMEIRDIVSGDVTHHQIIETSEGTIETWSEGKKIASIGENAIGSYLVTTFNSKGAEKGNVTIDGDKQNLNTIRSLMNSKSMLATR